MRRSIRLWDADSALDRFVRPLSLHFAPEPKICYRLRYSIEAGMRTFWRQLVLTMALAVGSLLAFAQKDGMDAALLAKANAGDASAQVLVGESYAEGKTVARGNGIARRRNKVT
jgi:hypothetical protein